MTDRPEEMEARAKRAFERSTDPAPGDYHGPVHPDELARMERALLSLSRTTREIFLAVRLDGYSYDHIAKVTGLSQRQVARRMRTAIRRLGRYRRGDERPEWQVRLQRWRRYWPR
ncbi:sigma factor-like helix-turn-helix DNA-binding protein [Sphingomonas sp. 4RDLI-65]|uniref:sigma factor-like helix-turn-helix DNA-binding protein n=1 Tax=Sphingomonas sp. 4RDLI-65 TaxID=3111641 RepID=UPI003C28E4C1